MRERDRLGSECVRERGRQLDRDGERGGSEREREGGVREREREREMRRV